MTYCTSMCERAEEGFTIDALLQVSRKPRALSFIEKEMIGQALDEMQDWEEWLGKEV